MIFLAYVVFFTDASIFFPSPSAVPEYLSHHCHDHPAFNDGDSIASSAYHGPSIVGLHKSSPCIA